MSLVALGNKHTAAAMPSELPSHEQNKTGSVTKGRVGTTKKNVWGFRSARGEEEEDRCAPLCPTDVETSSGSVEDERKCAGRRAPPACPTVASRVSEQVVFQAVSQPARSFSKK